jgi:hypothetical protein
MFNISFNTENRIEIYLFGGAIMRKLSDAEVLSLSGLLTAERDGLAVARAVQGFINDDEIKKQADAAVLASEGRIRGIQQFINENQVTK